jgi:hypothetical protein
LSVGDAVLPALKLLQVRLVVVKFLHGSLSHSLVIPKLWLGSDLL